MIAAPCKKHPKLYVIGGSALKPTPIKDKEVELILRRMDDSKVNPTQKLTFEVGESIRALMDHLDSLD